MRKHIASIVNGRCGIPKPCNADSDILIVFSCRNDNHIILMSKTKLRSKFLFNECSRFGCR